MRSGARAAGLLLVLLAAAPVAAAAAPVCRVIPDARGDAGYGIVTPPATVGLLPGTPADDLLSADVASDGRRVTALWRVGTLPVPDPVAPLGRDYTLVFDVRGKGTWFLAARTYPTGTRFFYGDFISELGGIHAESRILGQARGRLDTARGTVVVDAPAAAFARGLRKGTLMVKLHAAVGRVVGQGLVASREVAGLQVPLEGTVLSFDAASGDRYVVGARSCVRPGL